MLQINYILVPALLIFSAGAFSQSFVFNPSLLDGGEKNADLSVFEEGGQLPGEYNVDIIINNQVVGRGTIYFKLKEDKKKRKLFPCLTEKKLYEYGFDLTKMKDIVPENGTCTDLDKISDFTYDLNFNAQALKLTVPERYLMPKLSGIAPQMLWDNGISAFLMSYDLSSTRTAFHTAGQSNQSNWLNLSPGLNIGPWRFRNKTIWERNSYTKGNWQTQSSYAERGFSSIRSRLTIGDGYTQSDIFESVPLRGVMLNSDESMVSPDEYQYTPIVRGVARTQARVEIKQDGYTIYNHVVNPGPFTLTNVNANSFGGNLKVIIWETDGNPQTFLVALAKPAISIKQGYLRYGIAAGYYRPLESINRHEAIFEATAEYGLPLNLTIYGGSQSAQNFKSASLGLGVALGEWGAVSADVADSRSKFQKDISQQGDSYRLRYNKSITNTDTSFSLEHLYYSGNYNTFSDIGQYNEGDYSYLNYNLQKKKNRTGVFLIQGVKGWGNLSFSGYFNSYRNGYPSEKTINAAYTFTSGRAIYSINWSQTQILGGDEGKRTNHIVSVWISLPLSRWIEGNTYADYRWSDSSTGKQSHTLGISGNMMNQSVYWSASQSYRPEDYENRNNGNLSVTDYGTYGQLSGNYSYNPVVNQTGAGIRGGIVVHRHGIIFGQPLNNTVGLIDVSGVSGINVGGIPGIRTDFRGYTIDNSLIPYQLNDISINPSELPSNVDMTKTDINVVPTEGAIIPVKFAARRGERAIITVHQEDGSPVPFGALATYNSEGSIVGEGGELYLSGLKNNALIKIKWSNHQCYFTIKNLHKAEGGMYRTISICK